MSDLFTDSSALAKRYVNETGSQWLRALMTPNPNRQIYVAAITSVEVIAAIARRQRGGTLSPTNAQTALQQFRADFVTDYQFVEITDLLLQSAMNLAERYALRGYDAVQLAAGLEVNALVIANGLSPIIFVSADAELNRAAASEGLPIDDPNAHP